MRSRIGKMITGTGKISALLLRGVVGIFLLWFLVSMIGFGISSTEAFGRILSAFMRQGPIALLYGLGAAGTGCYYIGRKLAALPRYVQRVTRESDSTWETFVLVSSRSLIGVPVAVFSVAIRTLVWPLSLGEILTRRWMARNESRRDEIREYWEIRRQIEIARDTTSEESLPAPEPPFR